VHGRFEPMDKANPAQERFAELIWRTVKLRVSLLIASVALLLVTWSSLTNGNIEAAKVDVDFCRHLENKTTEALNDVSPKTPKKFAVCTPEEARNYIEASRAVAAVLPLEYEFLEKQRAELAEYDQKRRAAYKLEIGLSSQGAESKIIVNALSVAEVVPFVVVLILSIVMLLGFQQNAYRWHLRRLLKDVKSREELNHGIAGSQFLSGLDIDNSANAGTLMILSPEGAAIWVSLTAVTYLLYAVLAAFIINLIHLTSSIFLNYLFALYTWIFVLVIALWRTHLKYGQHWGQEPKRTSKSSIDRIRWLGNRWSVCTLVAVALASMFFPWTTPIGSIGSLKGYSFVLKQKPIFQNDLGHTMYPVDPKLLSEIRFQLLLVAIFLASCVFSSFFAGSHRTATTKTLKRTNWLLALVTVFLSLNYLIYMGVLEFWADIDPSVFFANLTHDAGFPMNFYDPAFGFLLFLFCCLMLGWISLRESDNI